MSKSSTRNKIEVLKTWMNTVKFTEEKIKTNHRSNLFRMATEKTMRKVTITLTFDVEQKDLQHQYVSEFISNARSGKMRQEVEDSAAMGNTPIQNVNVECKIL